MSQKKNKAWCPACRKTAYRTLELAASRAVSHDADKEPYPCPVEGEAFRPGGREYWTGPGFHYGQKRLVSA